jgi:hypothetical protein
MKSTPKKTELAAIRKAAQRIEELQQRVGRTERVRLQKKMFVGHWRFLVVRVDVLRSSIGQQVQLVVDHCNHWVLGRKKISDSYRCSTEVRISPGASTHIAEQYLRPLGTKQWEAAKLPEHIRRKWFETVITYIRAGTKNIPVTRYFPTVPRHMLEYGFKPAYIEEVDTPKPAVESELAKLYQFMHNHDGWTKLGQNHRDEWDLSLTRKRDLVRLLEREARTDLEIIHSEQE